MKMNNTLKTAVVALLATTFAPSTSAMDPEFIPMNPMQAKMRGTYYKNLGLAPTTVETVERGFVGTDTLNLIKAFQTTDLDVFVLPRVAKMKININGWIDSLLVAGDGANFLEGGVNVGGLNLPADVTRGAFKTAFGLILDAIDGKAIDGAVHGARGVNVVAPDSLTLSRLNQTFEEVTEGVQHIVNTWIDTLLVNNAAQDFIDGGVTNAAGGKDPAGRSRDEFKNALAIIITDY